MSIINDALRKAQKENSQSVTGYGPDPQQNQTFSDQRAKNQNSSKNKGSTDLKKLPLKPLFIAIAIIIGLIIAGRLIFKPKRIIYISKDDIVKLKESEPQQKAKQVEPIAAAIEKKAPEATSAAEPQKEVITEETVLIKPSQMRITGIVTGRGEPFAIINDKIYQVGDKVGTAEVIKITDNTITFDYNGRRMTFTIDR